MKTTTLKFLLPLFLLVSISEKVLSQPLKAANGTTPSINITSFNVYAKENKLCFSWATDGVISTNVFEVQQSTNGADFSTVAMVLGPDPKQKGDNYGCSYSFKNRKAGQKYFYRLKHVDVDGNEQMGEAKELIELAENDNCKK